MYKEHELDGRKILSLVWLDREGTKTTVNPGISEQATEDHPRVYRKPLVWATFRIGGQSVGAFRAVVDSGSTQVIVCYQDWQRGKLLEDLIHELKTVDRPAPLWGGSMSGVWKEVELELHSSSDEETKAVCRVEAFFADKASSALKSSLLGVDALIKGLQDGGFCVRRDQGKVEAHLVCGPMRSLAD